MNEIKDALQASFYCYYYHSAILAAIFGFGSINLLTGWLTVNIPS